MGKNLISEMAGGLPGIDEATSFSQMIKYIFVNLIKKIKAYSINGF